MIKKKTIPKKTSKRAGRTKIAIDWQRVAYILKCGGKGTHAASDLGIHADTIYNRCLGDTGLIYSDFSALHRQKGDALLFIQEFEQALSGDRTMLIWLSKNRLGRSDSPQIDQEFSGKLGEILDHIKQKEISDEFKTIPIREA